VKLKDLSAIRVGDTARLRKKITPELVESYAQFSGDRNPLHVDAEFARGTTMQRPIAHGMVVASYVSQLIGMELPGPGALWVQQTFRWIEPVFVDDTLEIEVRVSQVSIGTRTITVQVGATNQMSRKILEGEGVVMVVGAREKQAERSLAQRSVLITGGSRGIGAATARAIGALGGRVTVLCRNSLDQALEVQRKVEEVGGQCLALEADVTLPGQVRHAVALAAEKYGQPVDVLVNCAGQGFTPTAFLETSWDAVRSQIETHVGGAYECCQAVIPGMLETGSGCIVNVGSTHAWSTPAPQWTGFAIAKSGLKALTRSLASEFGPKGIRVNMVSPGLTETEFLMAIPERARKLQAMQTPLRRLASADDVAETIVFLCSERAQFLTGADIPVCGGSVM